MLDNFLTKNKIIVENNNNEFKRNEFKRNESKRNDFKRNDFKRNDFKRNDFKRNESRENEFQGNVWSEKVKAGKKTYFIDLKTNEKGLCLVIKESRKASNEDGSIAYRKSKIDVYPEDVTRFIQAVQSGFQEMKRQLPDFDFKKYERRDAEWKTETETET